MLPCKSLILKKIFLLKLSSICHMQAIWRGFGDEAAGGFSTKLSTASVSGPTSHADFVLRAVELAR